MTMIASARLDLPVDPDLRRVGGKASIYAIDSTTIDLCLKLFPWARFRRRKGGVKAHTMIDLRVGIPVFMCVAHAKTHDLWMLDQITPQAGAYYVMDRGYIDFARLYRLHLAGAFFFTRSKRRMDFRVVERRAVRPDSGAPGSGVVSDRLIRLRGPRSRRLYPDTLRVIRYVDPQTGKRLRFLTNNLTLAAPTIALLYRKRWRIELFFKWVKQHLHIKAFFGTSPNAVKTQLWIAVITYILVVQLKHRHGLAQDLNKVLQILSVTILEKSLVSQVFSETNEAAISREDHKQLLLFDL